MTTSPHTSTQLWQLSATELAAHIKTREVSAREAAQSALERMEAVNPKINAIVECRPDEVLDQANAIDAAIARGEDPGILAGVPITTKDMTDHAGYRVTNGLRLQKDNIVTTTSPAVDNLLRAGAVMLGRTNNPAFCMRWFTDNQLYGATLNPHNPALTPGGSSGGGAAATACGIGHIAQGTDMAGSVSYPAYACGIHGLRPSLGRIPDLNASHGDPQLAIQIMGVSGPLARTVADIRLALEAMSAADTRDPWWCPVPLIGPEFPRRAAVCFYPEGAETDPLIVTALKDAAGRLREAGWQVETIEQLPPLGEAAQIQDIILMGEEDMDMVQREGDPGAINFVARSGEHAEKMDLARFSELLIRRGRLIRQWAAFLIEYPLLLLPVSTELPFPDHLDMQGETGYQRVMKAQMSLCAWPALGLPCMALTMGTVSGPLGTTPIGIELVAGRFREDICLAAGAVIEAAGPVSRVIDPQIDHAT